jgi:hypothetical protein
MADAGITIDFNTLLEQGESSIRSIRQPFSKRTGHGSAWDFTPGEIDSPSKRPLCLDFAEAADVARNCRPMQSVELLWPLKIGLISPREIATPATENGDFFGATKPDDTAPEEIRWRISTDSEMPRRECHEMTASRLPCGHILALYSQFSDAGFPVASISERQLPDRSGREVPDLSLKERGGIQKIAETVRQVIPEIIV